MERLGAANDMLNPQTPLTPHPLANPNSAGASTRKLRHEAAHDELDLETAAMMEEGFATVLASSAQAE